MVEPDRWERWAPVSGIVFAIAFLWLFFFTGEPPTRASGEELASFYQEQGEGGAILQFFLVAVAAAGLLWFSGSLRAALRRMELPPGRLSGIAFGGGVGAALLLSVTGALFISPAAVVFEDLPSIDPTLHAVVSGAGFISLNFALVSSAVMIGAASLAALRFGGLPKWFVWVSFVVALALFLNILFFLGLFVWVAWVLVASIVLMVRPVGTTPAAAGGGA